MTWRCILYALVTFSFYTQLVRSACFISNFKNYYCYKKPKILIPKQKHKCTMWPACYKLLFELLKYISVLLSSQVLLLCLLISSIVSYRENHFLKLPLFVAHFSSKHYTRCSCSKLIHNYTTTSIIILSCFSVMNLFSVTFALSFFWVEI